LQEGFHDMNKAEAIQRLKSFGTAQNRKIYGRHGVGSNQYGVSYANQGKMKKEIKTDHRLARALWGTGNHDARVLATMIADPDAADNKLLQTWAKDLDNYIISDSFSGYAGKTSLAKKIMEKWTVAKGEWVGRTGWLILARLAMSEDGLSDNYFLPYLRVIESDIHTRRNRVRDAMNSALIAIGMRNGKLQAKAIATASKVGKIKVDHGETGCKTPDAVPYILKAVAHKKKKASKAKR